MLFSFLLFMGCAETPPETWSDLMTSTQCAKAKDKNACRAKECKVFYGSPPQSTTSDGATINTFCNLMELGDNQMSQVCGLPACLILPTVSPQLALQKLEKDLPKRTHQKMARKTIIRGFLQDPKQFKNLIEVGKNKDFWLGVTIAEVDCGEESAAKKFQLPCGGPYTKSAQKVWDLSQTQPVEKSPLLMHLATMLDPKPIIPKLISVVIDAEQDSQKRIAAGNALQIAVAKGYIFSPSGLQLMKDNCKHSTNPNLGSMCMALEKVQK